MKSIVLMDCAREAGCTFGKLGGEVFWADGRCAFKFLVIDGVLVIAPLCDHGDVRRLYRARLESPPGAKGAKPAAMEIAAAGTVALSGLVTGWESVGFHIHTPAGMRDEIQSEIMRLLRSGALSP